MLARMLPPRCLTPFSHPPCARQDLDSPSNRIRVRADMLIKIKGNLLLKARRFLRAGQRRRLLVGASSIFCPAHAATVH